jgi:hypothetical protein
MGYFRTSRNKRTTSTLVLVVWLFALLSGIANACLSVEKHDAKTHVAPVAALDQTHLLRTATGDVNVIEGDDDSSHAIKALCLEACDDRSHSLPKQDLSVDQPGLGPVTIVAILWGEVPRIATAKRLERDNQTEVQVLPVRVRYSRLAL